MKDPNWKPGAWWHAIGSDERYEPKTGWWQRDERRAYAAGIRDAMRILEEHAWQVRHHRMSNADSDRHVIALQAMHKRAKEFE